MLCFLRSFRQKLLESMGHFVEIPKMWKPVETSRAGFGRDEEWLPSRRKRRHVAGVCARRAGAFRTGSMAKRFIKWVYNKKFATQVRNLSA